MALTLITGPMFADKTTTMIDLITRSSGDVVVIKPETDNRYANHEGNIIAHNGKQHPATSINPKDLLRWIQGASGRTTFFIDEYHFFSDIVVAVKLLLERGCDVVAAGIDLDYTLNPMPAFAALECLSKRHIQLKAKCGRCGVLARYTKLATAVVKADTIGGNAPIIVGGAETYSPSCHACFFI